MISFFFPSAIPTSLISHGGIEYLPSSSLSRLTKIPIAGKAAKLVENGDVIFVVGNNDILVNAIQRFANVIIQKSIKEGFALTVTEALWKAKPVVAGNVGGIPTQIKDGETGFLVDPHDYKTCADRVVKFLEDPEFAQQVGNNAKEYVMKNFLTTRLLSDYLDLLSDVLR